MDQVGKGWLLPHQQLHTDGRPLRWKPDSFNIRFRLGALQADKLRPCGDLKRSLTNFACTVSAPDPACFAAPPRAACPSSDKEGGDWALFKADHEETYKQLPIDPPDQKNAVAALRRPASKLWCGFATRTLNFGPSDAVLHYNVLSRILVALTNRCWAFRSSAILATFQL